MTQIQIQGWNFRIDELAPQDQITIAQLVGQARGWPIPSQLLSMMPYLATIVALTVISGRLSKNHSVVPSSLGKPFFGSQ